MARSVASIVVDLEPDADPIAGSVQAPGQSPRAFTGWTGLFAALRAVTAENGAAGAASDGGVSRPRHAGLKRDSRGSAKRMSQG
jgi:hypothetical protein